MNIYGTAYPSADARELAHLLRLERDIQRQILIETIESAESGQPTESGRTICPDAESMIKSPAARFPKAVELQSCPRGAAGLMHTHTSIPQLRYPEHSLPDMANVLFGNVDASLIVGVDQTDVMMSPIHPEMVQAEFRDALGVDAQSAADVVNALNNGNIPSPSDARRRVRSRLPDLFEIQRSRFGELTQRVNGLERNRALPAHETVAAHCPAHAPAGPHASHPHQIQTLAHGTQRVRNQFRGSRETLAQKQIDPVGIVITSIVTNAVGQLMR